MPPTMKSVSFHFLKGACLATPLKSYFTYAFIPILPLRSQPLLLTHFKYYRGKCFVTVLFFLFSLRLLVLFVSHLIDALLLFALMCQRIYNI